ncbi:S1/P1 nuclease [Pseudozobellia thermophila]|uniref:S1/P1 Nuclease n=1 Tax=Pseudozobellia thermophila TaxID=192903 RepID=A0A1M6MQL6_9FLAO|nr:S1/P1 nuclease [Pseudozobellia thermophila]SHJ85650.1 S1/P1 Nuclease [Pseudozobellia thermophila]
MKKVVALVLLISNMLAANTGDWSKTGHRTVGQIAEKHLSRKAKRAIGNLLQGQSLARVANFGDEIKSDTLYRKFSAWHYVNLPADAKYTDIEPSKYGDIVIGIEKCIQILKDKGSSAADKAFYLKMLVHLIGDLHQPMHVGRAEDKGGNTIQLQWFNKGTNLHRVWDSHMIDDYGMSYTELAGSLPKLDKAKVKAIQQGNIYDWLEESQGIANKIYASVENGEKLYYRYSYVWWGTVENQLQKGGLRLAKVLNDVFS